MIKPFWIYLACVVVMLGGAPAADQFRRHGRPALAAACLALLITASLVIFGKGVLMASDWSNPFTGRSAEIARTVHSPRGGMAVGVIAIWPYALMGAGAFFGIAGSMLLRRSLRRTP